MSFISSISHWRICSVLLPGSHQVPNVQDPWDSQDVNCQIASSWCGLDIFISQAQHTTTIFYNISLATQAACKHISIYIYIKPGDTSPSRWLDTLMKPNVREFIKFRNCFSCTHFVLLMGKCCKLTGTWNTGSRLVLHSFFPTRAMVCLESASSLFAFLFFCHDTRWVPSGYHGTKKNKGINFKMPTRC